MIGGLLGKKIGMTQIFTEDGTMVPVTVIQAGPCHVLQVKTKANDGYDAVQLGFDDRRRKNSTKPASGHAKKAKVEPKRFLREVGIDASDKFELGQALTVDLFKDAKSVDVIGTTIGKGYQGGMKRHNFGGHPASHGASKDHRAPGSIGSNTDPGTRGRAPAWRPIGQHPFHHQELKVVKIDTEKNLLMLRGAVPGYGGAYVIVRSRLVQKGQPQ